MSTTRSRRCSFGRVETLRRDRRERLEVRDPGRERVHRRRTLDAHRLLERRTEHLVVRARKEMRQRPVRHGRKPDRHGRQRGLEHGRSGLRACDPLRRVGRAAREHRARRVEHDECLGVRSYPTLLVERDERLHRSETETAAGDEESSCGQDVRTKTRVREPDAASTQSRDGSCMRECGDRDDREESDEPGERRQKTDAHSWSDKLVATAWVARPGASGAPCRPGKGCFLRPPR